MSSTGTSIISLVGQSQDLDQYRKKTWEGSFEQYLDIVRQDPAVTRNAFQRVHDMILSTGTDTIEVSRERHVNYRLFSDPFDELCFVGRNKIASLGVGVE